RLAWTSTEQRRLLDHQALPDQRIKEHRVPRQVLQSVQSHERTTLHLFSFFATLRALTLALSQREREQETCLPTISWRTVEPDFRKGRTVTTVQLAPTEPRGYNRRESKSFKGENEHGETYSERSLGRYAQRREGQSQIRQRRF